MFNPLEGSSSKTGTKVILSGSYDVGFTMNLVNKDLFLFNKLAKEKGINVELGKTINKIFKKGMKHFGKRSFSTKIVKLIENENKVKFRSKNFPKQLKDINSKQKGVEI